MLTFASTARDLDAPPSARGLLEARHLPALPMSDELFPYRPRSRSGAESAAGRRSRPACARLGRRPRVVPLSALSVRKDVMVRRAVSRSHAAR
jgi:hypothetical protein